MAERSIKIAQLIPLLNTVECARLSPHLVPAERQMFEALRANPRLHRSQLLRRVNVDDRRFNVLAHSIWRKIIQHCSEGKQEHVAEFLCEKGLFDKVIPQLRRIERQLMTQGASHERLREFYRRAASIVFHGLPVDVVESSVLVEYARKHEQLATAQTIETEDGGIFLYSIITSAVSPYTNTGGTLQAKRDATLQALAHGYEHFQNVRDRSAQVLISFVYAYHLIIAGEQEHLVGELIERIRTIVADSSVLTDPEAVNYADLLDALAAASKGEHEHALECCRRRHPNDLEVRTQPPTILLAKCESLLSIGDDEGFAALAETVELKLDRSGKDIGQRFRIRLLQLEHAILCGTPAEVERARQSLSQSLVGSSKPNFTHESIYRSITPFVKFPGKREIKRAATECEVALRWLSRHGMQGDHAPTLALRGLQSLLSHAHEPPVLKRKHALYREKLSTAYGSQSEILCRLLDKTYARLSD